MLSITLLAGLYTFVVTIFTLHDWILFLLNTLKEKVVFVGGATISLYPDRQVFEVRPTNDVDIIIETLNYTNRAELEEKLRAIGFSHDIESGIICRYMIKGIIVDIMPTNDPSIAFSNK